MQIDFDLWDHKAAPPFHVTVGQILNEKQILGGNDMDGYHGFLLEAPAR